MPHERAGPPRCGMCACALITALRKHVDTRGAPGPPLIAVKAITTAHPRPGAIVPIITAGSGWGRRERAPWHERARRGVLLLVGIDEYAFRI